LRRPSAARRKAPPPAARLGEIAPGAAPNKASWQAIAQIRTQLARRGDRPVKLMAARVPPRSGKSMAQRQCFSMPLDGFNDIAMCRTGPMIFNRHDLYIGASLRKYGEWSAAEIELLLQGLQPGAVVVEIGANIGAHTVALSRLVGPRGLVIAFEPQRLVFQTLCANLALNSCANVKAYQVAIGAQSGEIAVPFLPPDRPANFGGLSLRSDNEGERVVLCTIDQFALPACHLLKMDIEGMEVEALRGAAKLIAAQRPVLYAENDRRERSDELISLLRSWNYRVYWHKPPIFSPTNYAGDQENIFENIASHNVYCVPREGSISVRGLQEIGI
jgi:FkbM family methyltransferase